MTAKHASGKKGRDPAKRTSKPKAPARQPLGLAAMVAKNPVRWAIIAYALLSIIVFAGPIFSPDKMVYGTDSMSAGVFFRTFASDFVQSHMRVPLWNPYIHGGLPYVDAMHGDMFYPAALLQIIFPVTYALGLKLILHVFLAGVFMFLYLRGIGRANAAAFIGGALYMFTPCLVSLFYPGHDGKLYVTALTPLAFLALHRGAVSRRLGAFLGFGLVYALIILTAHVQMAFYAAWGLGLYFFFLMWKEHRFHITRMMTPAVFFIVAVILALGASSVQWMSPYQYQGKYSQRLQHAEGRGGYAWATSWSMGSEELLSEINPDFPGENIQGRPGTYWGQNPFKLNSEAVGLMAVALAIVAVVCAPGPMTWFFGGLSLLALLHAMGGSTPVFRLFFHFVPMVNKFRAPSMINFLFAFSWIVMAARSLEILIEYRHGETRRGVPDPLRILTIIATVYSGITLLSLVLGRSLLTGWAAFIGNPLTGNKGAAIQAAGSQVSLGFVIGALVLWALVGIFHLYRRTTIGQTGLVTGLLIIAVIPLWQFNSRFVMTVDPNRFYSERPILRTIQNNAPDQPYRVLNLPGTIEDNYLALHGIEEVSPSAMHGNHLLTYDNFVGRHDPQPALLAIPSTMDLCNVRLIVAPQPVSQAGFEIVAQSQGLYLLKNNNALPRAAVFYQYEIEPDSNLQLARLRQREFPYRSRLILDGPIPQFNPVNDGAADIPFTTARVVEWDVDRMVVECTATQDGLLWLSENYYPAWQATDESGETLPIYRADYTFRAVPIAEGTHRITFEFHSEIFTTSVWLSEVSGLILLAGFGWSVWARRREDT